MVLIIEVLESLQTVSEAQVRRVRRLGIPRFQSNFSAGGSKPLDGNMVGQVQILLPRICYPSILTLGAGLFSMK